MIVKVVCATGDLSVNRRATRITAARLCIITFVMLGGAVMYVLNEFLLVRLYIFTGFCNALMERSPRYSIAESCSIDGVVSIRLCKGYLIYGAVSSESAGRYRIIDRRLHWLIQLFCIL